MKKAVSLILMFLMAGAVCVPVGARTVLSAKLCQVWISEVGFSLIIVMPAAILYGIKVGVDPLFYLRALLVALGVRRGWT